MQEADVIVTQNRGLALDGADQGLFGRGVPRGSPARWPGALGGPGRCGSKSPAAA